VPINSKIRTRGVVAFLPNNPVEFFLPSEQEMLDNFLSILVTSLERIHFTQIAIQTEILLAKQNSPKENVKG
jgi:two-component system sensor histidine kinase KdpD